MHDVLRHANSTAVLKGPPSSLAAKTQVVQKERQEGGKKGADSNRKFSQQWKSGRSWLEFRTVEHADLDTPGSVLLVTAMFCKWCEVGGFELNSRGKQQVWTHAGGGCQRAKIDAVKEHETSQLHQVAANLPMNQSGMKEAVKTAILQDDRVLLNLTNIIYCMAKNYDSLCSYSSRCLAAEMLSVEVKTKGEDGCVTRDTQYVDLGKVYRSSGFAREIVYFMDAELRAGIKEDFKKSKFHSHVLDEATARTKKQHLIQYISYWKGGRVIRLYWNIVPIKAQDAKTVYEADKSSLLPLTDGDEKVLHKGNMGVGGDGASVISGGLTGVAARYKEHNPRLKFNHCVCHKSSLSAADGAAGVPELAIFDSQVRALYNFFGASVERRTMHSEVQTRMHETVRHLRKGIVTRCVCVSTCAHTKSLSWQKLFYHLFTHEISFLAKIISTFAPTHVHTISLSWHIFFPTFAPTPVHTKSLSWQKIILTFPPTQVALRWRGSGFARQEPRLSLLYVLRVPERGGVSRLSRSASAAQVHRLGEGQEGHPMQAQPAQCKHAGSKPLLHHAQGPRQRHSGRPQAGVDRRLGRPSPDVCV